MNTFFSYSVSCLFYNVVFVVCVLFDGVGYATWFEKPILFSAGSTTTPNFIDGAKRPCPSVALVIQDKSIRISLLGAPKKDYMILY